MVHADTLESRTTLKICQVAVMLTVHIMSFVTKLTTQAARDHTRSAWLQIHEK